MRIKPIKFIRILLLTALVALLIYQAKSVIPAPVGIASQSVMLGVVALAVGLGFLLIMPDAVARLWSDPDLLLPLVCLELFRAATAIFLAHFAPRIGGLAQLEVRLSQQKPDAVFLYELFILFTEAIYATWVTLLLSRLKRPPGLRPVGSTRHIGICFACILTSYLLCIGTVQVVVHLANAYLLPLADWLLPYLLTAGTIAWNLYTAALVTESVHEQYSYFQRLRSGFTQGGIGMLRWALPVTFQLALAGVVTYVSTAPFTHAPFDWISDSNSLSLHHLWFGGYSDMCWWYYDRLMLVHTAPPVLVTTLLSLLMGMFSVGVRLTVLQRTNPLTQTRIQLPSPQQEF